MKALIATFALASIVATSTIAVARDAKRIPQEALHSTEYGSPNGAYVAPRITPIHSAPGLPFTWVEKRAFDWATQGNSQS
jgi:hypothetical protein